jgi:hypothetical protein
MTLIAPSIPTPAPHEVEVLFREARRRRRRRRLGWLLVFSLVAGVTTVVVLTSSKRSTVTTNAPHGRSHALPASLPKEVVGWTSGFKLVVVSSQSGAIVRTLASNVSIAEPGIPDVSVAANGTVFFDSDAASSYDNGGSVGDQIFSVPIAGGKITHVAAGIDPQVSPDGRMLAYVASDPQDEAPYLSATGGIAVADLADGTIANVRILGPGPAHLNKGLSDLSWSSDSRHLSFDLLDGSTDVTTSWALAVDPGTTSLASAHQIPITNAGVTWNGYWGMDRRGAPQGLGVLTHQDGSQQIVTLDPATGGIVARLFRVPGVVCVALSGMGPPACSADFSNAITGDAAGENILIAGAIPLVGSTPTTSGRADLYRWSSDGRTLVRLTPQVLRATWGPASR